MTKDYAAEFKLSITKALGDQLAEHISQLEPAALSEANVGALLEEQGVYQLYRNKQLVYVGKADKTLHGRLEQHRRKISGRQNIHISEMSFTCLYVAEDLAAVAPERLLIDRHRRDGGLPWNVAGFGNNDPGRQRDTTRVKTSNFDALFPIRLDWPCPEIHGDQPVVDILRKLKACLPYLFRYETNGSKKQESYPQDFLETRLRVPAGGIPVDVLLQALVNALPEGWQITALPGYVIMYRERQNYASALKTYRRA